MSEPPYSATPYFSAGQYSYDAVAAITALRLAFGTDREAVKMPPRHRAPTPARVYTLVVELDDSGLQALLGRQTRIVLARGSGSAQPNAVWLAWVPARLTRVVWSESYGIYAAEIPERSGAPIRVVASAAAVECAVLPFLGDSFAPPRQVSGLPGRQYEVSNASCSAWAFGMLQAAAIDGIPSLAPLNAVVLPPGFKANFTAFDRLYLWAQEDVVGATVTARIPECATPVVYADRGRIKRYRYDAQTGLFFASPRTAVLRRCEL